MHTQHTHPACKDLHDKAVKQKGEAKNWWGILKQHCGFCFVLQKN